MLSGAALGGSGFAGDTAGVRSAKVSAGFPAGVSAGFAPGASAGWLEFGEASAGFADLDATVWLAGALSDAAGEDAGDDVAVVSGAMGVGAGGATADSGSCWGNETSGAGSEGCASKRPPNVAAALIRAAGGPLALNCKGAAALDSRKKESRLIRNSANRAKAQLMPMIEASTATIIRRTFGNIRPRRRPAAIRQSLRAIGLSAMNSIHGREIVIGVALKLPQIPAAPRS